MHKYQNTEKKSVRNTIYFTHFDSQVYTNIGMLRPDSYGYMKADNEAAILMRFFYFLQTKKNDLIFNVPRGKMDFLEEYKLKYFLAVNGTKKD